jgi:hypothetical protein
MPVIRQPPSLARAFGFEIRTPSEVEVQPTNDRDTLVRCRERGPDGAPVGELEVAVFRAPLVIDRDGVLEAKAHEAVRAALPGSQRVRMQRTTPVSLAGATGYRGAGELVRAMGASEAGLRYVHAFAIAPEDAGVDGGVLVTVRSATASWPAAEAMLASLRVFGRRGASRGPANDSDEQRIALPILDDGDE